MYIVPEMIDELVCSASLPAADHVPSTGTQPTRSSKLSLTSSAPGGGVRQNAAGSASGPASGGLASGMVGSESGISASGIVGSRTHVLVGSSQIQPVTHGHC